MLASDPLIGSEKKDNTYFMSPDIEEVSETLVNSLEEATCEVALSGIKIYRMTYYFFFWGGNSNFYFLIVLTQSVMQ